MRYNQGTAKTVQDLSAIAREMDKEGCSSYLLTPPPIRPRKNCLLLSHDAHRSIINCDFRNFFLNSLFGAITIRLPHYMTLVRGKSF